jgi:hypothetical protein
MTDKNYDLEKVYDEKIHPLMDMVADICKECDMPFITSFQYSYQVGGNGDESHGVVSSVGLPANREVAPVVGNMIRYLTSNIQIRAKSVRTMDGKDVPRETIDRLLDN